jgi:formamidopyrimidine-DNA glycosylase
MPEGVEVKLCAELIRPLVVGKTTASFHMGGRYQSSDPEGLREFADKSKVLDVQTKGKFMYWSFENDWYMYCTFGMSGQWSPKKGKHPALGIEFTDGSEIYFNDPRHFGTIKFVKGQANLKKKLAELGWDPLADGNRDIHLLWVQSKLKFCSKTIGEMLMNQSIYAGVGNYIRAEALYASKISPWRSASSLTEEEVYSLCDSIVSVMQDSYAHQGATIQTYATPYGEEGKYSTCFKVYGQKQDPLGNSIIKEATPDGRTIHWCPTIQH